MTLIRSRVSRMSAAGLLTVSIGLPARAEDPVPPKPGQPAAEGAPPERPIEPKAAPRPVAPALPGEEKLGEPAPIPPRKAAAAPQQPAAAAPGLELRAGMIKLNAVPVQAGIAAGEARAVLPANVLLRQAIVVPRRVIIDANGVQRVVVATFEQWAFGSAANGAELRRKNLGALLQNRIDTFDAICALTPQQRTRLEFAGRGDISRLFESLTQVKADVEAAKDDYDRIEEIYRTHGALRLDLMSGPFGEDSLLFKSIEPLLDADQAARFEAMREVLKNPNHLVRGENGLLDLQMTGLQFDDNGLLRVVEMGRPGRERPIRVRRLYLNQTQVTDAGLARLPGSEALETLSLTGTAVTDAGLADLRRFPNLRHLYLSGLPVTDETLKELGQLKLLTTLHLANTKVTDAGTVHLRSLTNLTSLTLQGTSIGDESLAHLKELANLQSLLLSQTNVTDAGIESLRTLPRLRILYVRGSQVTKEGIAELKKTRKSLSTDIQ